MEKKQPLHTSSGWNYKKVNKILEDISERIKKEDLSFHETQAILSWLQCDLVYKMAQLGTKNFIDTIAKNQAEQQAKKSNYIQ